MLRSWCEIVESEQALVSTRSDLEKSVESQKQSAQSSVVAEKLKVKFTVSSTSILHCVAVI